MNKKHWNEAQQAQRAKNGTNIICSKSKKAAIVGNPTMGWKIVTPERQLSSRTARGVELILEEEEIPPLGWD